MIRKIIISVFTILLFANLAFGQNSSSTPTAEETKEAQELAAKFYNRFAETQDITPLIDEFFVSDFTERVNYCFKTVLCGGFGRDFWTENDYSFKLIKFKVRFFRYYATFTNYIFLLFKTIYALIPEISMNPSEISEEKWRDIAKVRLTQLFDKEKRLLNLSFKVYGINSKVEMFFQELTPKFKTVKQFEDYLLRMSKANQTLRIIDTKIKSERLANTAISDLQYKSDNFDVNVHENKNKFFNYPIGTRIVEAWLNTENFLPFKMDLIKENDKLKIVAIYPPMD